MSSALDVDRSTLPVQKYSISLMSFLLAYSMQKNVAIFHWKWSLLLLLRALYAFVRCVTPSYAKVLTVQDLHTVLAPIIGVVFVSRLAPWLPQSVRSTYIACCGYDQSQWIANYAHHHRRGPSCCSTASFHE